MMDFACPDRRPVRRQAMRNEIPWAVLEAALVVGITKARITKGVPRIRRFRKAGGRETHLERSPKVVRNRLGSKRL